MTWITSLIPAPYRWAALAALLVAIFGYGWVKGAAYGHAKLERAQLEADRKSASISAKRSSVTEKISLKYSPALTKIRTVTKTIIKEVPTYVSASDCPLSPGFRVFHDAAAKGELPNPARISDAAAVSAPAIANAVADNYGTCLENAKRLEGLQEWVRAQQKLKP